MRSHFWFSRRIKPGINRYLVEGVMPPPYGNEKKITTVNFHKKFIYFMPISSCFFL